MKSKEISRGPCPSCGSSDGCLTYDDGHRFCFVCNKLIKDSSVERKSVNEEVEPRVLKGTGFMSAYRGITVETYAKYEVTEMIDKLQYYPYYNANLEQVATKLRYLEKKGFRSVGDISNTLLFGQQVFPPNGKIVTITEGELDSLSVYQMFGSRYPCVSVRSATYADKDCIRNYEYLNSFEEIRVCFDSDEPGDTAARKVAQLFDPGKVKIVTLEKGRDPNDYLQDNKDSKFTSLCWAATYYAPDGIITDVSEFWKIANTQLKESQIDYPWKGLQAKTFGIRTGELVLITAFEGVGKTQIMRELEYHCLKQHDKKDGVGIIHFEEPKHRTVWGMMSRSMHKAIHLPTTEYSKEEFKDSFDDTLGTGRVFIYDHFGSNSIEAVSARVKYFARVLGCRYIFLDHISIMVSDQENNDERRALDEIMTKLRMLVQELDISLVMVSHLNDEGKTRGSRAMQQLSDVWIDLRRDHMNPNPIIRNTTDLFVKKNRFSGFTGPAGSLLFDSETATMTEVDTIVAEEFTNEEPTHEPLDEGVLEDV